MTHVDDLEYWREHSRQLGFAKTEQAEKDYLQELLLMELYGIRHAYWLVFRGGTAVAKLYGSGRFSEDLDFILDTGIDSNAACETVEKAIGGMKYYYDLEYARKNYRSMVKYVLKVEGPVYMASKNPQARQTISMDMNTFEKPMLKPANMQRVPVYQDLRPYTITAASKDELADDKVKAIMERTRPVARDLYDLWVLVKRHGAHIDARIAGEKLTKYPRAKPVRFGKGAFNEKLREIGRIWDTELRSLMAEVPDYRSVARDVKAAL